MQRIVPTQQVERESGDLDRGLSSRERRTPGKECVDGRGHLSISGWRGIDWRPSGRIGPLEITRPARGRHVDRRRGDPSTREDTLGVPDALQFVEREVLWYE